MNSPDMTETQAIGFASLLLSLGDLMEGGFNAVKHAWRRSGRDEIWTFEDSGARCAAAVPGDGRTQVRHVTLLASAFAERSAGLDAFVSLAQRRLKTGEKRQWD